MPTVSANIPAENRFPWFIKYLIWQTESIPSIIRTEFMEPSRLNMEWKLEDAKNNLGEVVKKALQDGPQKIVQCNDSVIVLSESEYRMLVEEKKTLKNHLMQGPDFEGLDLSRDRSAMREPSR